tara:strand:+ start:2955 stop:3095 length:141 start_codon:yes stop_codon:yes gene_type:complete
MSADRIAFLMVGAFGLVVGAKLLGVTFEVSGISKQIQDGIAGLRPE